MSKFVLLATTLALAAPVCAQTSTIPVTPLREDKPAAPTWKVKTAGGLSVESSDGRNKFVLDGRLQFDTLFFSDAYNASKGGGDASDNKIRRARLGVGGVVDGDWQFDIIFDINDDAGRGTVDTAEFTYTGFEDFNVTVGRFKRPFYLEALTSSKWITSIERSLSNDFVAKNTARHGFMLSQVHEDEGQARSWYLSVQEDGVENVQGRDAWGYYGRYVYAPRVEKTRVLHFGAAYGNLSVPENSTITLSSRLGVSSADSRSFAIVADDDEQMGLEAAWMEGPLSIQGELVERRLGQDGSEDVTLRGGYVQIAFNLTGESRVYKTYPAKFDKIVPANKKMGAIELLAKVDRVKLDAAGNEAEAHLYTFGGTWYMTKNLRLMANYLSLSTDNVAMTGEASGHAVTTRLGFVF